MADLKTAFESLQASVAKQQTVDASVLALVQGMQTQLTAMASQETIDPADVQALSDTLAAEQANLSFAVTQGTGTPAALGTNANPIFTAVPNVTGGAITTNPVTPVAPVIPVVTDPVVPAAPEVPVDVTADPSVPTSTDAPDTETEPAAPVVVDDAPSTDEPAPVEFVR